MKVRCPSWCAGGHYCTAQYPSGEHSSAPDEWKTGTGKVVATRHQRVQGEAYVTVRLTVPLPAGDDQARQLGGRLITAALEASGAVLGKRSA